MNAFTYMPQPPNAAAQASALLPRQRVKNLPGALVWSATMFNFALCFAKTMGVPIGLQEVAGLQLLILALAAYLVRDSLIRAMARPALLLGGWLCVLALVNPEIELKIGVDLAIPVIFYGLGRRLGDQRSGSRVMLFIAGAVLAIGLFEMFALETFEHFFNIFAYFMDKGALSSSQAGDTGTTLAENGMRAAGDGRQLFPVLGLHRVGSVFLEPISAGNFAVICIVWFMATRRSARGLAPHSLAHWLLPLFAAAIGILADARFSVLTSAAVIVAVLTPFWRSRLLIALMPFGFIALLLGFVAFGGATHVDNTVAGRLLSSGALLSSWDWRNWFGLIPAGDGTFDAGYAYLISNIGLLPIAFIWLAFASHRPANPSAARYALGLTIYMSLSLCVSGSSLSIKTAALLWFLFGCLDRPPAVPRAAPPRRTPATAAFATVARTQI